VFHRGRRFITNVSIGFTNGVRDQSMSGRTLRRRLLLVLAGEHAAVGAVRGELRSRRLRICA
ncbi:MAG: hypothetical protein AAFQ67_02845, partial [Pseudomonadota bacterium]